MTRVVVVGAGVGGLAVAARLARLRHDVVVIERSPTVGGRFGVREQDGFTFDTGPTEVALPAALRDLFRKTGKPLESVVDLEPLDSIARHRFADGVTIDLPNSGTLDVVAAFDAAFGGRAADDWRRFMQHEADVWAAVRGPYVESLPPPHALARLAARHPRRTARVLRGQSVRGVAGRLLADPRQRQLVESYVTRHGLDPARTPAALAVVAYVEQTFRVWRVVGGMRRLVAAMHDRAQQCGAEIRTGATVTRLTGTSRRVDGVELHDGSRIPADVVISDTHRDTADPEVVQFLLGVRGRTPGVCRDMLLHDGSAPTVVHVDTEQAPRGDESWVVRTPWAAGGAAPSTGEVLDRVAAAGYDLRERVSAVTRCAPPPAGRPSPTSRRPAAGLYLVGDRVHPVGGVAMAVMSAAAVADAIDHRSS